ncbi:MAG TPA: riboflavin synthase, partial [Planctomycetaceae bacterium]|nr:riboflavin synthase [Planctomycetaceae bacterium]
MFTGLVEARGSVVELIDEPPARRLEVEVGSEWVVDSAIGDSVAINGCCLTVV